MKISVIIPVYKAEKFVKKAVESVLQQEETGEVLLIEDNSPDNSLKVCFELEKRYEKVKLFRHSDGKNKGAGASRNLGIKNAKYDFIAFLDADDYYLPNRFKLAKKILEKDKSLDGVYEAIGMQFYDSEGKKRWISGGGELLTTIKKPVREKELFECLVSGGNGYIHLDGLVVKKKLLEVSGNFPENLRLHQDAAFIIQLAAFGLLFPGELKEPVALRGIHSDNRITQNDRVLETRALLWKTLLEWAYKKPLDIKKKGLLYRNHLGASYQYAKRNKSTGFSNQETAKFFYEKLIKKPSLIGFVGAIYMAQKYCKIWL
jgi:glycosyltransferase involved in cell wall biosynthesis